MNRDFIPFLQYKVRVYDSDARSPIILIVVEFIWVIVKSHIYANNCEGHPNRSKLTPFYSHVHNGTDFDLKMLIGMPRKSNL